MFLQATIFKANVLLLHIQGAAKKNDPTPKM